MPSLTRGRAGVALAALVVLSAVLRFAAARGVPGPFVAPDEMIYALLGRGLWSEGRLSILGADTPFYSLLYPLLVGGPLSLEDRALGFSVLQAVQAVVVSSTAVVVYAWGRSFLPRGWALAAAGLSLTPPALAYAGLVMTEVLFLPLMTVAAWALARALEHPSWHRQAWLGLVVVAACATRVQAVVLVPVILTAVALAAGFARDRTLVGRFVPAYAGVLGLALAWSGWQLRDGGPWTKVLGGYAGVSGSYDVADAARFVAWHEADVFLLVAGVPLLALGVLAVEGVRGRLADPAARAFTATALSLVAWLAVEAGVFASRLVGGLTERYLVAVLPLLFLALALWLSHGAARPQPATALVAGVLALPALLLPIDRFAVETSAHDALMTVPLRRLAEETSGSAMRIIWIVAVIAVTLAFALLPRAWAPVTAVGVGAALVAASVVASDELERLSRERQDRFFGGKHERWIDAVADGPVTLVHDGSSYWTSVWHQLFWNERITSVVHVGPPVPGPLRQRAVAPRFDGVLFDPVGAPLSNRLVAAPMGFELRGEPIAEVQQQDIDRAGLVLWRIQEPAAAASWTTGVQPNGDFSAARVRVYACRPGRLEVTLLRKDDQPVRLLSAGRLVETVRFAGDTFRNASIPSPPGADGRGSCRFDLVTAGLAGSTRIEYVVE